MFGQTKRVDEFSNFHPIINMIFYITVLGLTMFQMQAGLIVVSFFSALIYHFYLKGRSGLKYLAMIVGVFLATAIINPLFSHKGVTLLFYLPTGNPVTLESLIYGGSLAIMVCGTLLWFSSLNAIVTQDKLIEIVGRIFPHFALLLSMIFRFVPKYTRQIRKIHFAQKALGKQNAGWKNRLKNGFETFSITTTWALENSVDTADSMRARGYGMGKRSTFHNHQFQFRDYVVLVWILCWTAVVFVEKIAGRIETVYYPFYVVKGELFTYGAYLLLCLTPILINMEEALRWYRSKSKI
jgi:energy-coupling factor transport system permease protein